MSIHKETWIKWTLAVVLSIGLLLWAFVSADLLMELYTGTSRLASRIGKNAVYAKFGDIYNHLLYVGLALGGGFTLVLFFWNKNQRKERFVWIYVIILLILVPLSMINYFSGDWYIDRMRQAFIDLVIATLGLVVLLKVLRLKPSTDEGKVMKGIAIFFVSSQAILVPIIYFILWIFNFQGLISLADTKDFDPNWITYITAIGGLIVSVLNYRLSLKSKQS